MLRTVSTVRMLQALAAVLALAIVMWTTGFPGTSRTVEAAAITNASDTLSDSAPGVGADHTIRFTTENGLSGTENFVLTFASTTDGQFDLSAIDTDDIEIAIIGSITATNTVSGVSAGANQFFGTISSANRTITLQAPSNGLASSSELIIRIGEHAPSGNAQIINPNATSSYAITIGGAGSGQTGQDTGEIRVAIIEQVTVTASVDTVLEFTVSGVDADQTVNGSPTTTAATTTPNALPFGVLDPNTSKTLAHDLSVRTNAIRGFNVTVQQSGDLESSTGADINSFANGSYTSTPSPWSNPSAIVGNIDTYGHWGLTSNDPDFSATPDRWVAASSSPVTIFENGTVADATQTGTGTARIGYQIEVSLLQEAGNDYTTTLTYIATPTF